MDISSVAAEYRLTEREAETVKHALQGLTSKDIARRTDISPNTVRTHLRAIMIKMDCTTRVGIIREVVRELV